MIFEAISLGVFVVLGLGWVSSSLDKIAKEMRRANDLKEAEIRSEGVGTVKQANEAN